MQLERECPMEHGTRFCSEGYRLHYEAALVDRMRSVAGRKSTYTWHLHHRSHCDT